MSTLDVSTRMHTGDGDLIPRFGALPQTAVGWVAAAAALAYIVLATVLANTVLGLPTWLDFALGLAPGALALTLIGIAVLRQRERSWVLWVAAIGAVFYFSGWLVFAAMAAL